MRPLLALLLCCCALPALDREAALRLIDGATAAMATPEGSAMAAIALRQEGPAALALLGERFDQAKPAEDQLPRWDELFDAVAAQRHARQSRLYWYTDLEQAEAAAVAANRPIVSLRLLGRLSDEQSCANSRFFRVALYADPLVADWLRGHAILHWSSERPVPVVTIDFGDGRSLRTTITGNSAHVILDGEGRPLDCIPGLLGPKAFLAALQRVEELHRLLRTESRIPREQALADWHRARLAAIAAQRAAAGVEDAAPSTDTIARAAGERALSKRLVEAPLLIATRLGGDAPADGRDWGAIAVAAGFAPETLSRPAWTLASAQLEAARETPVEPLRHVDRYQARKSAMLHAFEASLLADTAHNELDLHRRIHERLAAEPTLSWAELDRWLYAEVFLTPATDPWLGLGPDTYSALPANGKVR
jgi:hypothetical protein